MERRRDSGARVGFVRDCQNMYVAERHANSAVKLRLLN